MSDIEQFGYREQLARSLSTLDLVVYGMVFMVPIAYLLGLVGMLFTALSYASMSRAFPVAGSVYAYAHRGLHEIAGFFAGWAILLDYVLIPALCYVVSVIAMRELVPGVPGWIWLVAFVSFNAAVNLLGMHFTARVNLYLLAGELLTLVLFVAVGASALAHGAGAGGLTLKPLYDPAAFSLATVAGATSTAVLSFLGFDGISTLAEENRGGAGNVGRATLLALGLVGLLFVVQTWIAADLAVGMRFFSLETAFYEICQRAGGTWLRIVIIVANVVATGIANAMAGQAAVSRILFAMARDGKLPRWLARVHPRYKTPYNSTLFVGAVSLVVSWLLVERLQDLTRVVNFGALTGFLLLHVAVINHYMRRTHSRNWFRYLLCPMAGFAVIAYVLYQMDLRAKVLGACWLTIGALYYFVLTRVAKKSATLELDAAP
jgi:amino acid transporter